MYIATLCWKLCITFPIWWVGLGSQIQKMHFAFDLLPLFLKLLYYQRAVRWRQKEIYYRGNNYWNVVKHIVWCKHEVIAATKCSHYLFWSSIILQEAFRLRKEDKPFKDDPPLWFNCLKYFWEDMHQMFWIWVECIWTVYMNKL